MLPNFLIPESTSRGSGSGPELDIGHAAKPILVTLGITRIIEQESLDIAVWGSADKIDWGTKPLLRFPQKFYCGTYSMMLDLSEHPHVRFLRAEYKMNRWGRGELTPLFGFYVFVEEVSSAVAVA